MYKQAVYVQHPVISIVWRCEIAVMWCYVIAVMWHYVISSLPNQEKTGSRFQTASHISELRIYVDKYKQATYVWCNVMAAMWR